VSRHSVVLLRERVAEDPFEAALRAEGFDVVFAPVLAFSLVNQEALKRRLLEADRYGGMVLTSPRAVAALGAAAAETPSWPHPAYVVGPATARDARALGLETRGEDAGNAAALAERIIADRPDGALLFPCGNRRRDTIPALLGEAGIKVDEVVVYETMLEAPQLQMPEPEWCVFFSPSGVLAADLAADYPWNRAKMAAIGPTTAAALRIRGIPCDAVASDPTPSALAAALLAH